MSNDRDDFGKRFIDGVIKDLDTIKNDLNALKEFKNKLVGALILLNIVWGIIAAVITGLLIYALTR